MSSEPNRKVFQCRGAESGMAPAPLDSSGERDFLRERIALWARITFFASITFFVAGFLIEAVWPPLSGSGRTLARPDILFELATCAILLFVWIAASQRNLSESALRFLDAGGTLGNLWLYACMAANMPQAWRPEMLFLLIVITILLTRAALVPSPAYRTAWISTLAAAPAPVLASLIYAEHAPAEVSRGQAVAYALLWTILAILLSTLASFVTFRLRKSVTRARRLGQYTLGEKLGEGGMGIVYRAEHEMLRRPTAIKLLPPGRAGEDSLKRFEREVQQTARLTNPHTVSIYDYGRTPDGSSITSWSTSTASISRTSCARAAPWRPAARCASSGRFARRSPKPTASASSTATSSRPTFSSASAAASPTSRRSSTSASSARSRALRIRG